MASSPLILTGRLSYPKTEKPRPHRGGSNYLIPTATQNLDRKRVPLLDSDVHRNITTYGRRTMMSLGRHLFCAYDVVRGAVNEVARLAGSSLLCEYRGEDAEFKAQVEAWTHGHDQVCDVAGWPYTARHWRKGLTRSLLMDGDEATVFVEGPDGRPYLQRIPGHRIASSASEPLVKGGEFDGAEIIEGVIVGEQMQPLGYRVLLGNPGDYANYQDVPASQMILNFVPLFVGQLRGFSLIGFSAWNWQDEGEAKRFELLAQKAGAGRVFQEWNEEGEAPVGSDYMTGPASGTNAAATPSGLWYETIDGGINTYFKSSDPSQRLEAIKFDRPSSNQREFSHQIIREALFAAGWSVDFSLDPTRVGGAPLRVVVDRINASLEDIREDVLIPATRRFNGYRVPVAMERLKEIKSVPDWYKLEYQTPARISADKKYDSDVTLQEVKFGIKSRERACMERDESYSDVLEANKGSVRALFTAAKELAAEFGIPFELALARLEQATPNESGIVQQKESKGEEE